MIIETPCASRIARFVASATLALGIWFTGLAVVTVAFEPDRTVTVFGSERALIAALELGESRLVTSGASYVTLRGEGPGFVRALYAGGAWLVLPALGRGCGGTFARGRQFAGKT